MNRSIQLLALLSLLTILGCNRSEWSADEQAFMTRCPEADMEQIPASVRAKFMPEYEKFRPRVEGNDLITVCDQKDITELKKMLKGKVKTLNKDEINGEPVVIIQIKDFAGEYQRTIDNYFRRFNRSFLRAEKE